MITQSEVETSAYDGMNGYTVSIIIRDASQIIPMMAVNLLSGALRINDDNISQGVDKEERNDSRLFCSTLLLNPSLSFLFRSSSHIALV